MSGSMLGKHKILVDTTTLADGDSLAAYLTSAAGTLLTHTTVGATERLDAFDVADHLDGSAYAAGVDYLGSMGVVNNAGNWVPFTLNAAGELPVAATVNFAGDYAEDSPHVSGDIGLFTLLVRQDTLAASTSADGDYGAFKSTNLGELYVADPAARASLVTITTNTGTTATNTGTIASTLTALSKAEDSAHVSGDQGIQTLAVRNDTPGSLVSANGDYAPLQVDATGNLRVSGTITLGGQFAEDSASASGDTGLFVLAIRRDTQGTQTSAAGDYSEIQTWSEGSVRTVDIANSSVLQSQVSVTDTATALPTSALANRRTLMIQNTGANKLWVGSATVTTTGATAGIELPANSFMSLDVGPAVAVFAIKNGAAGNTVNLLQAA